MGFPRNDTSDRASITDQDADLSLERFYKLILIISKILGSPKRLGVDHAAISGEDMRNDKKVIFGRNKSRLAASVSTPVAHLPQEELRW